MGITSEQIAELRELAEGARKGIWVAKGYDLYAEYSGEDESYNIPIALVYHAKKPMNEQDISRPLADIKYIAAANPQIVLALIAEIERLRAIAGDSE